MFSLSGGSAASATAAGRLNSPLSVPTEQQQQQQHGHRRQLRLASGGSRGARVGLLAGSGRQRRLENHRYHLVGDDENRQPQQQGTGNRTGATLHDPRCMPPTQPHSRAVSNDSDGMTATSSSSLPRTIDSGSASSTASAVPSEEMVSCMREMQHISEVLKLKHAKLEKERENWHGMKALFTKNLQAAAKRFEEAAIGRINNRMAQTFSSLEDVVSTMKEKVDDNVALRAQLEQVTAALQAERANHANSRQRHQKQLELLHAEKVSLEADQGGYSAQFAQLRTKYSGAMAQIDQLRAHVSALEQDSAEFHQAMEAKTTTVTELKKKITTLNKKIKVLKWQKQQPLHSQKNLHAEQEGSRMAKASSCGNCTASSVHGEDEKNRTRSSLHRQPSGRASMQAARRWVSRRSADVCERSEEQHAWRLNVLHCVTYLLTIGDPTVQLKMLHQLSPSALGVLPEWCIQEAKKSPNLKAEPVSRGPGTHSSSEALDQSLPGIFSLLKESLSLLRVELLAGSGGTAEDVQTSFSPAHKNLLQLQTSLLLYAWKQYTNVPYATAHKHYLLQRFIDMLHDAGMSRVCLINVANKNSESYPNDPGGEKEFVALPMEVSSNGVNGNGSSLGNITPSNAEFPTGAVMSPLQQCARPDLQLLAAGITLRLGRRSAVQKLLGALQVLILNMSGIAGLHGRGHGNVARLGKVDVGRALFARTMMLEHGFLAAVVGVLDHRHSAVRRSAAEVLQMLLVDPARLVFVSSQSMSAGTSNDAHRTPQAIAVGDPNVSSILGQDSFTLSFSNNMTFSNVLGLKNSSGQTAPAGDTALARGIARTRFALQRALLAASETRAVLDTLLGGVLFSDDALDAPTLEAGSALLVRVAREFLAHLSNNAAPHLGNGSADLGSSTKVDFGVPTEEDHVFVRALSTRNFKARSFAADAGKSNVVARNVKALLQMQGQILSQVANIVRERKQQARAAAAVTKVRASLTHGDSNGAQSTEQSVHEVVDNPAPVSGRDIRLGSGEVGKFDLSRSPVPFGVEDTTVLHDSGGEPPLSIRRYLEESITSEDAGTGSNVRFNTTADAGNGRQNVMDPQGAQKARNIEFERESMSPNISFEQDSLEVIGRGQPRASARLMDLEEDDSASSHESGSFNEDSVEHDSSPPLTDDEEDKTVLKHGDEGNVPQPQATAAFRPQEPRAHSQNLPQMKHRRPLSFHQATGDETHGSARRDTSSKMSVLDFQSIDAMLEAARQAEEAAKAASQAAEAQITRHGLSSYRDRRRDLPLAVEHTVFEEEEEEEEDDDDGDGDDEV